MLEGCKLHLAFFDYRPATPAIYGYDRVVAAENGIRAVKVDPATVLAVMSAATARPGFGATCSTTCYEPFHGARLFGTFDLMTRGRAAWSMPPRSTPPRRRIPAARSAGGAARQPRSRAIVRAKRAAMASRATCRPSATTVRPATMASRTAEAAETNT